MPKRNYSNTAPPLPLAAAVTAAATTITVSSTTGYPAPPFLIGLERGTANEEVALCTASTATTFTITRGYDGTTAKAHGVGSMVEHTVAALDYRESVLTPMTTAERNALTGSNLYEGAVVSNTDTNTIDVYHGGAWMSLVRGDDGRLTDARTPTSHTHDDRYFTETESDGRFLRRDAVNPRASFQNNNAGTAAFTGDSIEVRNDTGSPAISFHKSGAFAPQLRATSGTKFQFVNQNGDTLVDLEVANLAANSGTVGGQAIVTTNDARLSNARTPTAHASTHASGGSDPVSPSSIGAAERVRGGAEVSAAASGTSGTVTLNAAAASIFTLTPTGNVTTTSITNPPASGTACTLTLIVTVGATAYTFTPPSGTVWLGSALTALAANKTTVYTLLTVNGGTTWYASGVASA